MTLTPKANFNPTNCRDYLVLGNTILHMDLKFEQARFVLFMQLIARHLVPFKQQSSMVLTVKGLDRCFDAAFELARRYSLIYCEGIVLFPSPSGGIPLGHGWCCTQDGEIIDPTMPKLQADPRVQYLGVAFQTDYIARWRDAVGYIGILDGYPDGTLSPVASDHPSLWKAKLTL